MTEISSVTCTAPVNIAVIKYWGKRDEKLVLPLNSSLSVTLDQAQLRARTTVAVSPTFTEDRMWLNGQEQSLSSARFRNVLREMRRCCRKRKADNESSNQTLSEYHIHISSENNFPTAAGLASSAAGFACLVFSLSKLFGIGGDISIIARQGSGSASRSVYGGFVKWEMGTIEDGTDSIAHQVAPHTHWPELRVLILVVSNKQKSVGSSEGMNRSTQTSDLLHHRATNIVPSRLDTLSQAIQDRNFDVFAELTMKDSNQLHAVCLDTYPPISYLTDTSRDIIQLVHAINTYHHQTKVCYTFDAGPNACLYLPESSVAMVMGAVKHYFPPRENGDSFVHGIPVQVTQPEQGLLESIVLEPSPGSLQYIISTQVGGGPQVLDSSHSLLDHTGYPTSTKTKLKS